MTGVLILSANEFFAMRILRCLATLKIRTCVMGISKFHHIRLSRYCRYYHTYNINDLSEENNNIIDDINDYCLRQKLDIIIPAGMKSMFFLSKVGDKITGAKIFPIANLETLKMLNNKWLFTESMQKNGLPFPKTILINDKCKIRLLNIEFPIIIKPLDLDGGDGVVKLNSLKELEIYLSSENKFNKLPLLVQEYIPGIDIDFSVLAKNGKTIAWTAQKWQGKNIVQFVKDDNILDIGKRIVSSCNYNGVAHFDMRLDDRDQSIKIIECNPRFWGSLEMSMLSGVNFPYFGILMTKNEKLPENINYEEIKCVAPVTLMFESIRNMSLKDINRHNLYFLRKMIQDPLFYCYFIPIVCYKFMVSILKSIQKYA